MLLSDSVGGQGSDEAIDFGAADAVTIRRAEDERYAWFMEATVVQLVPVELGEVREVLLERAAHHVERQRVLLEAVHLAAGGLEDALEDQAGLTDALVREALAEDRHGLTNAVERVHQRCQPLHDLHVHAFDVAAGDAFV